MKKMLLIIGALIISVSASAQFILTPKGIVNTKDSISNYVIIEMPNKSQSDLYEAVCVYLNKAYKYPNHTQSKVENRSIQISGNAPDVIFGAKMMGMTRYCDLNHTINIEFKDEKIKFSILNFVINNQYTGNEEVGISGANGLMSKCIFDKKGNLRMERAKKELEGFFNEFIKSISLCVNSDDSW